MDVSNARLLHKKMAFKSRVKPSKCLVIELNSVTDFIHVTYVWELLICVVLGG